MSAGSSSSRATGATSPRSSPWPRPPSCIVRDKEGEVRAFHNICRHRGNKLVWSDYPKEETSGMTRQFVCKYHGWRYDLDGSLSFVQQEEEFFDFDKDDYGLVPVHCDVWAGFIFVNLAKEPEQSLLDFLGPMVTKLENYPFEHRPSASSTAPRSRATGSSTWTPSRSSTTHRFSTRSSRHPTCRPHAAGRIRGARLQDRRPAPSREHRRHASVDTAGEHAQADGDPHA